MHIDFLLLTSAPKGRVESDVIDEFYEILRSVQDVSVERMHVAMFSDLHKTYSFVKRAKVIVVHSPLVAVMPAIILGRILGAEIWSLVWDFYPVKISGRRYDGRISRRLADAMELVALKACEKLFVPSFDFISTPEFSDASVLRMWPRFGEVYCREMISDKDSDVLTIVFAGQVNATRGLLDAVCQLTAKMKCNYRLLIASKDHLSPEILSHPNVVFLGACDSSRLKEIYAISDFGLVSLAQKFEGPAFPSKTLDYIEHGLPVLYYGPPLYDYLSCLEGSGAGLNLASVSCIDHELVHDLHQNFKKKREIFMSKVCIVRSDVERLFLTSDI